MSKWYEVEMQVLIVYVVEVNDKENEIHARDAAYEDYTGKGRVTTTANPLPSNMIQKIATNADRILPLDVDAFCAFDGDDE